MPSVFGASGSQGFIFVSVRWLLVQWWASRKRRGAPSGALGPSTQVWLRWLGMSGPGGLPKFGVWLPVVGATWGPLADPVGVALVQHLLCVSETGLQHWSGCSLSK